MDVRDEGIALRRRRRLILPRDAGRRPLGAQRRRRMLFADEGPPVELELGDDVSRKCRHQIQQLTRGQEEGEPGRVRRAGGVRVQLRLHLHRVERRFEFCGCGGGRVREGGKG